MKRHRGSHEEFIPPFTLPLGEWSSFKAPVDNEPIIAPMYLLKDSGRRLCDYASRGAYDWVNDPDADARRRLLAALDSGTPEEPVEGETQALWRCLFAVVRAARFSEGLIGTHALALARIGNELRHRMGHDRPMPYFVHLADARVEAASMLRLPFEPPPWAMPYREELRAALKRMKRKPGHLLAATYAAPDESEFVDTENVVFYNVGVGAFASLSETGLRFERAFEASMQDGRPASALKHRLTYEQLPRDAPLRHWKHKSTLARWEQVPVPGLCASMKPALAWWAMRQAAVEMREASTHAGYFGLRITVHGYGKPLSGLMKPLFDGVIAAFHGGKDEVSDEVVTRLASQLGTGGKDYVRSILEKNARGVLPSRELVRVHRNGLAWNPQDELCLVGELQSGDSTGEPRISGEFFTISAL